MKKKQRLYRGKPTRPTRVLKCRECGKRSPHRLVHRKGQEPFPFSECARCHKYRNVWWNMVQRCYFKGFRGYDRYGQRGIRVCMRWLVSYSAFKRDMGPRPEGRTLDRIDPTGNYNPTNCRWATMSQQANNKVHNWITPADRKLIARLSRTEDARSIAKKLGKTIKAIKEVIDEQ